MGGARLRVVGDRLRGLGDPRRYTFNAVAVAALVVGQLVFVLQIDPTLTFPLERLIFWVLESVAFSVALVSLATLLPERIHRWAVTALALCVHLLALTDVLYFRNFDALPSITSLRYASQLGDVWSGILPLLRWSDAVPFVLAAIPFAFSSGAPGQRKLRVLTRAAVALALFGMLMPLAPGARSTWFGSARKAGSLTVFGYHLHDAGRYVLLHALRPERPESEIREASSRISGRGARAAEGISGAFHGKNVIVLQLESFQTFVLRPDLAPRYTPSLSRIAEDSLFFPRFFHQAGAGRTSDAQFATNCSMLPPGTDPASYVMAGQKLDCLPRVLSRSGYRTYSFQALEPDFWNAREIERAMGFDHSYSRNDFDLDELVGIGLSDQSLLRQVAARIPTLEEPFYLFVQTLTSHTPFRMPDELTKLAPGERGDVLARYLDTVAYSDRAIGGFFETLRERGILDESIVVLYGDHDGVSSRVIDLERINSGPPLDAVRRTWLEKNVPLLIRLPGGASAGEREGFGGQIDTMPTILDLLGIPSAGLPIAGRSLLSSEDEPAVVTFPDGSALGTGAVWDSGSAECNAVSAERRSDCERLAEASSRDMAVSRVLRDEDAREKAVRTAAKESAPKAGRASLADDSLH
ncbi:LTA synthase family protein [Vulgatibacter incomptus]|uniref:Lipoteichoic acid synthase LtaS Type IVb n=1 Tax=Vulgatibacter incomptus TaxID=1391653 RepID=A0A0K1P898_9BACT|nr:LTA synthase family protein [Vulgatibacter incomptus]AKU89717.1 Lipoteichoic acid synthase LtaS Type IVb [Vulgatibacter incomptus]